MDVIKRHKQYPEFKIKIRRYAASFYIAIYKGRYKVSSVYKSPYQRKYEVGNKVPKDNSFELIAFESIECEEEVLMEEYETKFRECLEKYPQPTYPVNEL